MPSVAQVCRRARRAGFMPAKRRSRAAVDHGSARRLSLGRISASRKLSGIFCVDDVPMAGTRNDHRLDAQVTPRRRLLPLWPNLVVSRARNAYGINLRQRFQRTDFVEADQGMSR